MSIGKSASRIITVNGRDALDPLVEIDLNINPAEDNLDVDPGDDVLMVRAGIRWIGKTAARVLAEASRIISLELGSAITSETGASLQMEDTTSATVPPPAAQTPPTPPLSLIITPGTQKVTRTDAGSLTTTVTYMPSGGVPPYAYTTTAPGMTISGGNTTTPSVSATLDWSQDTTFTLSAVLTDSAGSTPATATASVEFVASAPPALALVITPGTQTVSRSDAGAVSTAVSYAASGGVPPYAYSTAAVGLTVTNGTTTAPTVGTTLTAGQDTTYTVVGTLTDSIGTTPATASASVEFHSIALPLALVVTPGTQSVTRSGAGSISTTMAYAASGGVPPYGYSTSAPGLTVTGGTGTAPIVSTTLTAGQDTTFTVTGTLTDSIGSTPATGSASVEFIATVPVAGLALSVAPATQIITRSGAGAVSTTLAYTATGGVPPYTYTTSGTGLTITNGASPSPTVAATLTNGQDTTYTVTATVTDSAGTPATVTTTASVEFKSIVPALALTVAPATSLVTRSGAGSVSQTLAYTVTGGLAPYTYTTSAPGLTVTNGTTASPTVSNTLTNGQDTTYTVTATVTDSQGTPATATKTASVEFKSNVPPLTLTALPASQIVTRSGAGSVTAAIAYTAGGGQPPYTYATTAAGLTVTGGTTSAPSVATTLTNGQDTTFSVVGTVSDSIGTAPATATASVEFVSTAVTPPAYDPMVLLKKGINGDNIAQNVTTFTGVNDYTDRDMRAWQTMGFTCVRIPIDSPYLIPGTAISGTITVTGGVASAGTPSTNAFVALGLANLQAKIALFARYGIVAIPTLFIDKNLKLQQVQAGTHVAFMKNCMTVLANLFCNPALPYTAANPYVTSTSTKGVTTTITSVYYDRTKLMINLANEPRYDNTAAGWLYTDWSNKSGTGLMNGMIAAVRAVTTSHTIICDTVRNASYAYIGNQWPSADANTIYSTHVYAPTNLTGQSTTGFPYDPNYRYPRELIISPANPTTGYTGPFNAKHQKIYTITGGSGALITRDYWGDEINLTDPFTTGTNPPTGLDAVVKHAVDWANGGNPAGTKQRLIMGEFGCSGTADYHSRIQWMTDIIATAAKYSLPRISWALVGSDFGLRPKPSIDPLVNVLNTDPTSDFYGYDVDQVRLLSQ